MRSLKLLALPAVLAFTLTGCRSAQIDTTITNNTPASLKLIEVDYPSASFGIQTLAPGKSYHYQFKVIGSGNTTVVWTDAANKSHKSTGPSLNENDNGTLVIAFGGALTPTWDRHLLNHPEPFAFQTAHTNRRQP